MRSLSVVVDEFNIVCASFPPDEADTPLSSRATTLLGAARDTGRVRRVRVHPQNVSRQAHRFDCGMWSRAGIVALLCIRDDEPSSGELSRHLVDRPEPTRRDAMIKRFHPIALEEPEQQPAPWLQRPSHRHQDARQFVRSKVDHRIPGQHSSATVSGKVSESTDLVFNLRMGRLRMLNELPDRVDPRRSDALRAKKGGPMARTTPSIHDSPLAATPPFTDKALIFDGGRINRAENADVLRRTSRIRTHDATVRHAQDPIGITVHTISLMRRSERPEHGFSAVVLATMITRSTCNAERNRHSGSEPSSAAVSAGIGPPAWGPSVGFQDGLQLVERPVQIGGLDRQRRCDPYGLGVGVLHQHAAGQQTQGDVATGAAGRFDVEARP